MMGESAYSQIIAVVFTILLVSSAAAPGAAALAAPEPGGPGHDTSTVQNLSIGSNSSETEQSDNTSEQTPDRTNNSSGNEQTPPSDNTTEPENETTTPSDNTTEAPENETTPPSDNTTEVPENETTPSDNTTEAPENETTPPSDNTTEAPENETTPPSDNTTEVPENETTPPSNNTTEVPENKTAPPSNNTTEAPENETAISTVTTRNRSRNSSTNSSTAEVIVRVEEFEIPEAGTLSKEAAVDELRTHANETQQPVLDYAASTDGVTVLNRFWITNAVLMRVNTSKANASALVKQPGVTDVHRNYEVRALSATNTQPSGTAKQPTAADSPSGDVTYGLDQLNVPEVWAEHGTRGAGAKVAVLDTGADIDHPDLSLRTENQNDATYPGGWAEFDTNGDRVMNSTPHATSDHGTHVTGTVGGGDTSGTAVGVAPDADMMHGLVLPDGTGSFAQIIAGMQWAVEEDADVISMSLGADGFYSTLIPPIRNAEDAGTTVVVAAGNHGPETAPSPGNIYDATTVGASGPDRDIAPFSGGDVVRTQRDWGDAAPGDWPASFVTPDIAAPGVETYSTLPGGEYGEKSGTSMATPHISGVVALMVSASGGDLSPDEINTALRKSATKPADAPNNKDIRYGHGIVDALDATTAVAAEQGITGTVTNTSGAPIADATVTLDSGAETTTNPAGDYLVRTLPGRFNVTASEFGYEPETSQVTVDSGTMATHSIDLSASLDGRVTTNQTSEIKSGNAATVTYQTAHAETLSITRTGTTTENATLYVNGQQYAFGEEIALNNSDDTTVQVRVETTTNADGRLVLSHTLSGLGDTVTLTTGPTNVVPDPVYVGVVDSTGSEYANQVQTAVDTNVPDEYFVSVITPEEAMAETDNYDVLVVNQVSSGVDVEAFVAATDHPDTGVVYLDQWGAASNGITALSSATQNPVVTGQSTQNDRPAFEVVTGHPLFDGVASAGERVQIHNQSRGDIAWFDRYQGTTLATVGDGSDTSGTGIAIDESTQSVLLSSLGRTSTVRSSHMSHDANAILGNAVMYVNSKPPAWFASTQPAHVSPGDSFSVEVAADDLDRLNVTLTESTTLTKSDISLSVNGTEREFGEWHSVSDDTDAVTIRINTSRDIVGSVGLSVTADGDNETVELLSGQTAAYEKPLVVPEDVDTIQGAIDLAPPGTTVEVAPGTYTKPIEVTTPGMTLTAHDAAARPTIEANIPGFYDPVVHVDAPNVTVEQLDVTAKGAAPDGIAVERMNATIQDVSVSGAAHGVLIGGAGSTAHNAVVRDVNITNGASLLAIGVTVGEADSAHVSNATISGQDSGVDVYTSSDTVVERNEITDSGAGLTTFETDNIQFRENEIHDMDESASNTVGIQLEAFVTNATVVDNDIWNLSEGVYVEGTNTGGEIAWNDIDAEYGVWVDRADVPAVEIHHNDLSESNTSLGSGLDTTLRATMNYHGERAGNRSFVSGDVVYEPFLTAPPEAVNTTDPSRFGIDLTLAADEVYSVSVPGPTDQTVADLFSGGFEGAVYGFDANTQTWKMLSGDDRVAPLQGIAVVAESDGRMTITHHVGTDSPNAPAQTALVEGWNFVGAPTYNRIDLAFDAGTVKPTLATAPMTAPSSQPGQATSFEGTYRFQSASSGTAPDASPYQGYFVFVENKSTLPSYVGPNPSKTELYKGIRLYQLNSTASNGTGEEGPVINGSVSVSTVLASTGSVDNATLQTTLSQVIYRNLTTAVAAEDSNRSMADIEAAAADIVADAAPPYRNLTASAADTAVQRIRRGSIKTHTADGNETGQVSNSRSAATVPAS
ncbi:S8 family serine peptidase [Haloarcula argentinensis]|nr:S8 family serine peptidase [Haloarcula argentinensis]